MTRREDDVGDGGERSTGDRRDDDLAASGDTPAAADREDPAGEHRPRKRVGWLRRFVSLVAPSIIVILALEVVVRIGAWAWNGWNEYYLFYGFQGLVGRLGVSPWSVYDGSHFKFPPDYTLRSAAGQGEETARTNSLGFRGPDFEPAKEPGTFRVITLGGSSTFGFHNEDDETYPHYLQARFDEAAAGRRVEVINAGFPYYTSASIRSLLEAEILEYDPDLVTLYTAYNDASWPLSLNPALRALFWIQQHSSIYLVIKETVFPDIRVYQLQNRVRNRFGEEVDVARIESDAEAIAVRYRGNVEAIADLLASRGIDLLVIRQPMTTAVVNRGFDSLTYAEEYAAVREELASGVIPHPFEIRMIYHQRLLDELDAIARERGLDVLDNVSLTDPDRTALTSHVHLSAGANHRLAEALYGVISPAVAGADSAADPPETAREAAGEAAGAAPKEPVTGTTVTGPSGR